MTTNRAFWLVSLGVLGVAFALRTWGLGAESLWYDEGYTAMLIRNPWSELTFLAASRELNTPLHYLSLALWTNAAGASEFSGRYFSALLGVVCVALALGQRRRLGASVAAAAATLLALSPVLVVASRELRMYSLAATLAFASVTLGFGAIVRASPARLSAWAVSAIAAFATHVLAFFVVAAEGLVGAALALSHNQNRASRRWLVAAGVVIGIAALWLAWILTFAGGYGTNFNARLGFFDMLIDVMAAVVYLGQATTVTRAFGVLLHATILLAVIVAVWKLRHRAHESRAVVWFGAAELLAVAGIAALCAVTGKFAPRYASIVAAPALTAFAVAIASLIAGSPRLRARRMPLLAVATSALVLAWLGLVRAQPRPPNEDFRGAAAFIRENVRDDEAVLLLSGHVAPAFAFYFGDAGWRAIPPDPVLNLDSTLDYASATPMLNDALGSKQGAWLVEWQADVIDPTRTTWQMLLRQSPRFQPDATFDDFAGLRVTRFRFNQAYEPLPASLPVSETKMLATGANRGLESDGCGQARTTRVSHAYLELMCLWRVTPAAQLPWDTKVSLRLTDDAGRMVVQQDQNLLEFGLPSQPVGKPMLAVYRIELPREILPGDYQLEVVPYAPDAELAPRVRFPLHIAE